MITNSKRTVYAMDMNLHKMLGKTYKPLPNTTLNEKFGYLYDVKLEDEQVVTVQYYSIGVGGIKYVNDDGTYVYNQHLPTDAVLYDQIPFVMAPIDDDISDDEQANYRFKIKEIWNNNEYYCYYLKMINKENVITNIFSINKLNDVFTLSKFNTKTSDYLNPDPNYDVTVDDLESSYVTSVGKLEFSLLKDELDKIDNVLAIRYGENNTKVISEIGVCSGYDLYIEDMNVTEAVNVQTCYFATIDLKATIQDNINGEVMRAIEIGGLEPLKV